MDLVDPGCWIVVGIEETLKAAYPEIDTDLKALFYKVHNSLHVSGTFVKETVYNDMKDNAGLGLFFIKQITSLVSEDFF